MEQSTESVDYGLGHMSGRALAQVNATLNDEEVTAMGNECLDGFVARVTIDRRTFLAGHLAGYLEEIV